MKKEDIKSVTRILNNTYKKLSQYSENYTELPDDLDAILCNLQDMVSFLKLGK